MMVSVSVCQSGSGDIISRVDHPISGCQYCGMEGSFVLPSQRNLVSTMRRRGSAAGVIPLEMVSFL